METDKIRYFIPKVKNRIAAEKNRLWKHIDVGKASMRGYMPFKDADALKQRLAEMLGVYTPALLDSISAEDKETILVCAEQALHHEFDLLGSGPVHLEPIDWHIDFKSGNRWGKCYYRELTGIKGADIKLPWELSRCQHLLWLGEAYLLTGEGKYAQEVIDEINWWIEDNPLMYTVNWKCSMDVAFRAVNWMFSLNMISDYNGFDNSFANKVTHSLWQHGFFIRNNLERIIPNSNNHYASDIVGLLYLGELFCHIRKGRRWFSFAFKEYLSETRKQVLKSGVHYECSVSYHRMMTELLSYPVYMLQRIGVSIPTDVKQRIGKMYEYVSNYTKPNGFAPLIADNDDGRFVPFIKRDFRVHNYLNNTESFENRIVTVGMTPLFSETIQSSCTYFDAGVALVRDKSDYLYVNNGGYSKLPKNNEVFISTHTHNDSLSFELVLDGKDIIVDSGAYLYTSSPKDRDAFRSTSKHNTMVVDDEEQNGMAGAFCLKRNVVISPITDKEGKIYGQYSTLNGGLQHSRLFTLGEESLVIEDFVVKEGNNHIAVVYFHLAKGITASFNPEYVRIKTEDTAYKMIFSKAYREIRIEDDSISPSYGVLEASKTIVATFGFDNQLTLVTRIEHDKE